MSVCLSLLYCLNPAAAQYEPEPRSERVREAVRGRNKSVGEWKRKRRKRKREHEGEKQMMEEEVEVEEEEEEEHLGGREGGRKKASEMKNSKVGKTRDWGGCKRKTEANY